MVRVDIFLVFGSFLRKNAASPLAGESRPRRRTFGSLRGRQITGDCFRRRTARRRGEKVDISESVDPGGFEPPISRMRSERSTTELQAQFFLNSFCFFLHHQSFMFSIMSRRSFINRFFLV